MSFAPAKFNSHAAMGHTQPASANGLAYHRPISAANRALSQQQHQQAQQWAGNGAMHPSFAPNQRQSLSSTQPLQIKHMRGNSAGSQQLSRDIREAFAPVHVAPSARGQLSRTQPAMDHRAFAGLSINGSSTQQQQSPFHAQPQHSSSQQPSHQQWQHFRGPVAAMHPHNGSNTPVRAMPLRPQSSFPSNQRSPLTPNAMQQSYNIITGGPVGKAVWDRDETPSKMRYPVVVEHPAGTRVYQPMHSPDAAGEQQQSQQVMASGRSVGRQGSASQRSQSVDRNSRSGMRAASASAHQPSPQRSGGYSALHGHLQFDQSPSIRSPFQQQYQQPFANGHSLSQTSPQFSPASQYTDPQRFSPASPSIGTANGIRFSPNAAFSPSSPGPQSLSATARTPLGNTLALPSPASAAPGGAGSTSRPGSAGASSDDGAGFLEVGMAEDPNPRFRPTMEDSHVIKYGDSWVEEDAATARAGPKTTARARSSSLDWGSPTGRKFGGAGSHSVAHKGGPQKRVKNGYFAIYDGHGGREAVDYIERNLHRSLASKLKAGAHPAQALESAFLDTDAAMQQSRIYQESGSTVASALLRPSTSRPGQRDLFTANAGDARAVIAVQNGSGLQAVRLSRDHTPNDPEEAQRVRRAGGAVFRGRVDGQLAVSRAIGDCSLKRSGVTAQPHQTHVPLTPDHKFLIVACDGLWDVMTDTEAVGLIAGMNDANKMADKLVKTALARGTTDKSGHTCNTVSAMVVRLQK